MHSKNDQEPWHYKLQEARKLYRKIQHIPEGAEKERLLKEHKDLLREARNLHGPEFGKPKDFDEGFKRK